MVKITYDLDNKKESELIDDYYFLKYFTKSLCFDWKKFYNTNVNIYNEEEILKIIYDNINKSEYERLNTVYRKFNIYYFNFNKYTIIRVILTDRKNFISRCRYHLVLYYSDIYK